MKGLAGKRVVVTGGSSGIGAATAQRFRDEGAEVIVLARRPGPGGIACDVSDRDQVQQAFELVGDLDVLVNNAGVSVRSPAARHHAPSSGTRSSRPTSAAPSGRRRPPAA